MKSVKLTKKFIIGTTAIAIIYDVVMAMNGVKGDTISEVVWQWQYKYPLMMLGIGVILGHLFWQRRKKKNGNP